MISKELTTKWDKGELTTPKYIIALNEYAMSLEAKIAKLEAPKTCDGCKSIQWVNSTQSYNCTNKVSEGYITRYGTPCISKYFYCNRYEPKESK